MVSWIRSFTKKSNKLYRQNIRDYIYLRINLYGRDRKDLKKLIKKEFDAERIAPYLEVDRAYQMLGREMKKILGFSHSSETINHISQNYLLSKKDILCSLCKRRLRVYHTFDSIYKVQANTFYVKNKGFMHNKCHAEYVIDRM